MPFYVLCDVSWSMLNDIVKLNEGLHQLVRAIRAEPIVDDVARIAVMSFSDTARVVLPLGQTSESTLQDLPLESGTNYSTAFRALKATIDEDIADLKKRGLKVFRPCVFFLSDGEPFNDPDWKRTFINTLTYDKKHGTGNKNHPIFVPFGFRDADEADMSFLAYPPGKSKWFLASTNQIQDVLKGIIGVIMNTTMTTSKTANTADGPKLIVAEASQGSGLDSGESSYTDDFV